MSDKEAAIAEALIGDDADKFLRSELGRVILGIAEQEATIALEALKTVDPANEKVIREHQNAVWRAESFKDWLIELVRRGEQSLKVVEHDEDFQ